MMMTVPCQLDLLTQSKTTTIQFCPDCQEVHIALGPISLRLSRDHYQRFAADIAKAHYQLTLPRVSGDMLHEQTDIKLHS